jgi:hypothetical protein
MYLHEKQSLKNVIHRENEVRRVLNEVAPLLIEPLRDFVGQKIIKADESIVKKYDDKIGFLVSMRDNIKIKPMDEFEHASISSIYVVSNRYNMRVEVSISFQDSEHTCCYAKGNVYIGDVRNSLMGKAGDGDLEKVHDFTPLEKLSAAQEWKKYEKAANAKDAMETAKDAMWYGLRSWV